MKRLIFALIVCLSFVAGGTLIAHAGGKAPYIYSYIYDGNMARYFELDMDDETSKPEVECVVMQEGVTPTDMLFRTQIEDWRIVARWPAGSDQCDVMIWQESTPRK